MDDYRKLKETLRVRPYLIADLDGNVRLATEAEAFRALNECGAFPTILVTNIGRSLERLSRLEPDRKKTYTLRQVAKTAGWQYPLAYKFCRMGLIAPSVQPFGGYGHAGLFSWTDLFVIGAIGLLWRNRIPLAGLAKVRSVLLGEEENRAAPPLEPMEQPLI